MFLWQSNEPRAVSVFFLFPSLFFFVYLFQSLLHTGFCLRDFPALFLRHSCHFFITMTFLAEEMAAHPSSQCLSQDALEAGQSRSGDGSSTAPLAAPKKTWGKCRDLCPSALQRWTLRRRDFRKDWPCLADGTVLRQPEFHQSPDAYVCPIEIPVDPWPMETQRKHKAEGLWWTSGYPECASW